MFGIFFQYGSGRLTELSRMVNVKCCVPGCASKSQGFRYLKFHQLPKDNCRRKTWKNSIENAKKYQSGLLYGACTSKVAGRNFMQTHPYFLGVKNGRTWLKVIISLLWKSLCGLKRLTNTYACMPNLMEVPTCTVTPATDTTIQVNRSLLFILR